MQRKKVKLMPMAGITNLLQPPKRELFSKGSPHRKIIGNHFCLFLDYDDISQQQLSAEINYLRKSFPEIPSIWAFKTRENHCWLLSFGVFTRQEVLDIMFHSSCDGNYFKMFKAYGRSTLRMTEKPGGGSKLELLFLDPKATLKWVSLKHTQFFENTFGKTDKASIKRVDYGLEIVNYYQRDAHG
jgi:hypothetical protein